jgi:predicted glycosyltransferase
MLISIAPPIKLLTSGLVKELPNNCNLPDTTAAVTPGIAAVLMAAANPATVLLVDAGTVAVSPLITIILPAVRLLGVPVPVIVGQDTFQSSDPTSTQAFVEFLYLHRKRFQPTSEIRKAIGLTPEEKFILLRFISWSASHDIGQKGIPDAEKIKLVRKFQDMGYEVRISAEGALLSELEPYRLRTDSHRIHDVLAEAEVFIGESGTMATEACLLGTPAFLVNSLDAGVFREEVQLGLLCHFKSGTDVSEKILSKLNDPEFSSKHQIAFQKLHSEKIDFTQFLVWFFEHYPKSIDEVRNNPDKFIID